MYSKYDVDINHDGNDDNENVDNDSDDDGDDECMMFSFNQLISCC